MKKNYKTLFVLGALILLIISEFQTFITLSSMSGNEILSIDTIKVKGTIIVGIGIILLLYGCKSKNIVTLFAGYLASLGGYTYTYFSLLKVIKIIEGTGSIKVRGIINIKYEMGFYLYVLSAVVILISIFVNHKEKVETGNYNTEELDFDSFLLCNKILGIKEIPYNALVLLKKSDNNLSIEYQYEEKINNYLIPLNTIKDISSTQDMAIDYSSNELEDFNSANTLLSYSLLAGHPLAAMGANKLLDELTVDYEKGKITSWFIITIKYEQDGEILELKFKTKKNPRKFIEKLKNME